MNLREMIVLIVFIAVVGGILKARYGANAGTRALPTDPESDRLRDEVRLLRDRIQVLERVITDQHGSNNLDREIERLRDR